VIRIVGFGRTPTRIPDEELKAVQVMMQSGLDPAPCPFITVGEQVSVGGPLKDIRGVVLQTAGVLTLVVSISLLQRSISVMVQREWVRKC
jgi:transcription antitermination factor NusG